MMFESGGGEGVKQAVVDASLSAFLLYHPSSLFRLIPPLRPRFDQRPCVRPRPSAMFLSFVTSCLGLCTPCILGISVQCLHVTVNPPCRPSVCLRRNTPLLAPMFRVLRLRPQVWQRSGEPVSPVHAGLPGEDALGPCLRGSVCTCRHCTLGGVSGEDNVCSTTGIAVYPRKRL